MKLPNAISNSVKDDPSWPKDYPERPGNNTASPLNTQLDDANDTIEVPVPITPT